MRLIQMFVLFLMIITGPSICVAIGEVQVIIPEVLNAPDTGSPGKLQAEFTGAPTSGRAPLMVLFTDLTKGSPSGWLWDFGDGTSAVIVSCKTF